ncbi:MAG: hypothetical protein ACRD01_16310 [Terriglobales bacterium]
MALIVAACALLTVSLGWWVFTAVPETGVVDAREARRQALEERRQAVYENLKDLHFEHLAGKLTDADFQRTRLMLEQEAAGVVRTLREF